MAKNKAANTTKANKETNSWWPAPFYYLAERNQKALNFNKDMPLRSYGIHEDKIPITLP